MIEPGALRSDSANHGPLGSGIVGPPPDVFPHIESGTELFGGDDAVTGVGRGIEGPVDVLGDRIGGIRADDAAPQRIRPYPCEREEYRPPVARDGPIVETVAVSSAQQPGCSAARM